MRHMSFALTTPQILARTKTVTRRVGWRFLKSGDLIQAIEKGQGLKKGQRVRKLAVLRVENVRREPLCYIDAIDVRREGFPGMSDVEFMEMFERTHKGAHGFCDVTRIEFSYVKREGAVRQQRG
jgi:hypothetical protein